MYVNARSIRKMADSAFVWAAARNLVRLNSMHGEEEARLVLDESFTMKEEEGVARTQQVRMDVEEFWQHACILGPRLCICFGSRSFALI